MSSKLLKPFPENILCVDTETDGLNPYKGKKAFCVTVCTVDLSPHYFDLRDKHQLKRIKSNLENPGIPKVLHNSKFDIRMLRNVGITLRGYIHDTMLMARIAYSNEPSVKLEKLSEKYLDKGTKGELKRPIQAWLRAYEKEHGVEGNYSLVPRELMEPYALEDVVLTMELFALFWTPVYSKKWRKRLYEQELYINNTVTLEMEDTGTVLDLGELNKRSKANGRKLLNLERTLKQRKIDGNFNAPTELGPILEGLGLDVVRTDKGNVKKDGETLRSYGLEETDLIAEWQERNYTQVQVYNNLREHALEPDENGYAKVHGQFWAQAAMTGRFGSSNPNLQNKDKTTRELFIVPDQCVELQIDYKQIEMVLFAGIAGEEKMLEVVRSGGDLHGSTSIALFGTDDPEKRRDAKDINFGVIYGMGAYRMAEKLGIHISVCAKYLRDYYIVYPGVKGLQETLKNMIADEQPIKNLFGRRYYFPKNQAYKAVNYIVQGSAADLLKVAMIRVHQILRAYRQSELTKMTRTIHDELTFNFHWSDLDLVQECIDAMNYWPRFEHIPITVDVEWTLDRWSNGQPWKGKKTIKFVKQFYGRS